MLIGLTKLPVTESRSRFASSFGKATMARSKSPVAYSTIALS